jgi:hypothetical protein
VDAYEAGLWIFWVLEKEVIAVPRPAMQIVGDRLHCENGPAVAWPDGARYWFWQGVQVPQRVIEEPHTLELREILEERNIEIRRVMIDRYGPGRLAQKGTKLHVDEFGTLWRVELPGDEPLVVVEVVNSTPEPDGSFKNYLLRVPPSITTARQGVAWTFGVRVDHYKPAVQT